MRPKVTECRQSPEWPTVKQCLTMPALLERPSRVTDDQATQKGE